MSCPRPRRERRNGNEGETSRGFSVLELLVAMLMTSLVIGAAAGTFSVHNRTHISEDQRVAVEENLRVALGMLVDAVRVAGYGAPRVGLRNWIPWVSGFSRNPTIVEGSGTQPDRISLARCTASPVAVLTADASEKATSLPLSSTTELDTTEKRLILIGGAEHAHVSSIHGTTVRIDTDPSRNGPQGTRRAYLTGTPVCRVDVLTFLVADDSTLLFDRNQGEGPQAVADRIRDLQVETLAPGEYRVTLEGRSDQADPLTGSPVLRRRSFEVAQRNR